MKAQTIRLLDVFFVGPMMVRSGWLLREKRFGGMMIGLGVLTMLYNGANWIAQETKKPEEQK